MRGCGRISGYNFSERHQPPNVYSKQDKYKEGHTHRILDKLLKTKDKEKL